MAKIYKTTFKLRRGLAADWASVNPILSDGEPGFELDTFKLKIGNGTTNYNSLPYIADASALYSSDEDNSVVFVNTSNDLPTLGTLQVLYVVLDEKQIKTWNSTTLSYDAWFDKTVYVTHQELQNYATTTELTEVTQQTTQNTEQITQITEQITTVNQQITNVSEQVTNVSEQITQVVETSVDDVVEEDADNVADAEDLLYVRKSGEWIPLTAENTVLQEITQELIEKQSIDYGSIDDIV